MDKVQVPVGIIGCGPAGLLLSLLLARAGIDSVILESRDRATVEGTIRAGVLEHGVAALLDALGLGTRMRAEGQAHGGITLQWQRRRLRLDLAALTGGRQVMLYAQHELLKDLIAARLAQGGRILFGCAATALGDLEGERPWIAYTDAEGRPARLACRHVVGADGFHGPARQAVPAGLRREFRRAWPFAWLGILARAPRSWPELIYAHQAGGFALLSTRSATVQRLYLQVPAGDRPEDWPDERIWPLLEARLATEDGWQLQRGEIFQKSVVPLRSFVCETMQHGSLFLAGDAAHIVPPTGAKGLNLAVGDVLVLAAGLIAFHRRGDGAALAAYSATCLPRIWQGQRFSWSMTAMLHAGEPGQDFEAALHRAALEKLAASPAAARALAEDYAGLPFALDPAELTG